MESVDALVTAIQAGEDWEQGLFGALCAKGRELAQRAFQRLDDHLAEHREPGLSVEGYRHRVVLTRMGPVRVRRRLYCQKGKRRFLLDEALGWGKRRVLSPSVQALALELVGDLPYRKAVAFLDRLIAQCVGRMSLHRLVQAIGSAMTSAEQAQREAVYEQGQDPPRGQDVVSPLFLEADGLSIALQREQERRGELKAAVAYAGRERVGIDRHGRRRHQLQGKVTYAGMEASEPFWQGARLTIGARYDLTQSHPVVVGGDGAPWIRGALEGVPEGMFQLDRFHLARELRRVLGGAGMAAFQAARTGKDTELREILAQAWQAARDNEPRCQELLRLEHYLSTNRDGLVDWYRRVDPPPLDPVPLGAIEANVDKPYAQRFKKRGMSWTKPGAHHLAKVLQLRTAGQLHRACLRRPAPSPALLPPKPRRASAASTAPPKTSLSDPPFQATLVPRWGPHAARPWVQALRRLLEEPTLPG